MDNPWIHDKYDELYQPEKQQKNYQNNYNNYNNGQFEPNYTKNRSQYDQPQIQNRKKIQNNEEKILQNNEKSSQNQNNEKIFFNQKNYSNFKYENNNIEVFMDNDQINLLITCPTNQKLSLKITKIQIDQDLLKQFLLDQLQQNTNLNINIQIIVVIQILSSMQNENQIFNEFQLEKIDNLLNYFLDQYENIKNQIQQNINQTFDKELYKKRQ